MENSTKIVLCEGLRTVIGHLSKSLAKVNPEDLMGSVIRDLVKRTQLDPSLIDGVLVGWVGQGSHAPNIARIAALKAGRLPEKAHSMTIQANCISSMEALTSAARHIKMGEGKIYIAGGTESMSTFPYTIRGSRASKSLRSLQTVKESWANLWGDPEVSISDTMEEGLVDPIKKINMAATAELCAQTFGISRKNQDAYAHETFKRCLDAEQNGFYKNHTMPVVQNGETILDTDEYVILRKNLVSKPAMFEKAPALFNSEGFTLKDFYERFGHLMDGKKYSENSEATVTLFNSCARSDGAVAIILTTEEVAKNLGLNILGVLKSWAFYGVDPAFMGIAPVYATKVALERAGIKFSDLDQIEVHEAFAATCLSIFHFGWKEFKQDWTSYWEGRKLNPNGSSIALGHPLGATGARIVLNLLHAMKNNPQARLGLATACASGGLGGAVVIEKPQ
ncbi:MAG: thiolase family protein [Elusimicrobia bacterium]|nr:thiolase family protein [Candidatus Obscuribacterium magneticum]